MTDSAGPGAQNPMPLDGSSYGYGPGGASEFTVKARECKKALRFKYLRWSSLRKDYMFWALHNEIGGLSEGQ
jgi:hypothetical protein